MGRALWLVANLGPCFSRATASVVAGFKNPCVLWQQFFNTCRLFPVRTFRNIPLEKFYLSFYSTECGVPPAYPVISNFPQKALARQCYLNGEIKVNRAGGEVITGGGALREAGRTDLKSPPADCARISLSSKNVDSMLFPR